MAKTITTTTTVSLSGDGFAASPLFNETVSNTAAMLPFQFTTGPNTNTTVYVPSSVAGVLIVMPPGNTVTVYLKGANADIGIPLDPVYSTRLKFTAGSISSLVFFTATGSAPITVELVWL